MLLFVEDFLLVEFLLIVLHSFVDEEVGVFGLEVILRGATPKGLFWKSIEIKGHDIFIVELEPTAVVGVDEGVVMAAVG